MGEMNMFCWALLLCLSLAYVVAGGGIKIQEHVRNKRTVSALSSSENMTVLNKHNELRNQEGSSNMEYMEYDDVMAEMAQDLAETCTFAHGKTSSSDVPLNRFLPDGMTSVGQNLYLTTGTIDFEGAITAWYNEKTHYDFDSTACQSGKVCGHYTQVVWATTKYVGCGYKKCSNPDRTILVCNYGPPGNNGDPPFIKGSACTQCSSGQGTCYGGMCRNCSKDDINSSECDCKAVCHNCGVKQSNCTCACANGWRGSDCNVECKNTHASCGANPGWPQSWCTSYSFVLENCPLLCGLCKASDGSTCITSTSTTVGTLVSSTTSGSTTSGSDTTTHDLCKNVSCANGGSTLKHGDTCKCSCTSDWQGDGCAEKTEHALTGVILILTEFRLDQWPSFWDLIKNIISNVINIHCNVHFDSCCKTTNLIKPSTFKSYMQPSGLKLAGGSPYEKSRKVFALMYVTPDTPNDLCQSLSEGNGKRKRRGVIDPPYFPQDALYDAFNTARQNISYIASDCCNATLEGIQKGVIDSAAISQMLCHYNMLLLITFFTVYF